jgi:hypothetical protein
MKYASVFALSLGLLLVGIAPANDSLNVRLIDGHHRPGMACDVAVNRGYEWATPQQVATATKSRFGLDCYGRLWCLLLFRPADWDSSTFSASRCDGNQWLEPELVFTGGLACGLGGFDATRALDGRLWVLFSAEYSVSDSATAALFYDGAIWSDIVIMGRSDVDVSTAFTLESDSAGKVWAMFSVGEDHRIWADVFQDTSWSGGHSIVAYPTGEQVFGSRLTVTPNGDRWAGATAHYPHYDRVFLCRSDSAGNWPDSLIMGPGPTEGALEELATDNRGNVWVAWAGDSYGPDSGIYAACLDTALHWSPVYRISHSGLFGNMEIDGDNKVWVVWDANSNFYYRVWDGSEWSPEDSVVTSPASSGSMDAIFYDPVRDRIWLSYRIDDGQQTFVTWTDPSGGVAEESPGQLGSGRKLAATVVRGLPRDAVVFDAMGQRVMKPRSGVYFVRDEGRGAGDVGRIRKVVIQK